MPRNESVVLTRSHCVSCNKTIPWHDNIPILGYLLLRGRCRFCHRKISFRYCLIELLTAILTLLVWNQVSGLELSDGFDVFLRLVLTYALIVVSFIDLEFYIIPDQISYGGIVLGPLFAMIHPSHLDVSSHLGSFLLSVLGGLVGGGSLWLVGWVAKIFMKKEAMGLGDVKLMMVVGAWLGWKSAVAAIMFASILGSIVGVILVVSHRLRMESRVPFGPFLSLGTLIFMLWGNLIIEWYLNLFRISDFGFRV